MGYRKTSIILLLLLGSCSLDFPPEDQISDPEAIVSVDMAERGIAWAYDNFSGKGYALDVAILSDDFENTSLLTRNVSMQKMYFWDHREMLFLGNDIWESNYRTISMVNVILDRLPNVKINNKEDEIALKKIRRRAEVLKGYCYFEILKYFGGMQKEDKGILLKRSFSKTGQQERLSFYGSVLEIDRLFSTKDEDDYTGGWLGDDASLYLRAELALWSGDNEKCLRIAKPLYDKYFPIIKKENPKKLWRNEQSGLRIFYIDMKNSKTSLYNSLEYDEKIGDYLAINSSLKYDKEDVRNGVYSQKSQIQKDENGKEIYVLGKYSLQRKEEKLTNYFNVIRAEGLVFMCAEAYLKEGDKEKAVKVVNDFLEIRKSKKRLDASKEEKAILEEILLEKQKEFVGEGTRWLDLKRNRLGMSKKGLGMINNKDKRWIFLVPNSEVRFNKKGV